MSIIIIGRNRLKLNFCLLAYRKNNIFLNEVKEHIKYLKKVGFHSVEDKGKGWFRREVYYS